MRYTYEIRRDVAIYVTIDADDQDAAQKEYERLEEEGQLNYLWRDEVLEGDSEVTQVWEGDIGDGNCIYSIR